jgi:predicted nucleic acid-binding protein
MTLTVVDASVAVKWCLPRDHEDLVLQAEELLMSYRGGTEKFLVPDLFWLEVANALWKAVWRQKIDAETAAKSFRVVSDLKIPTVSSVDLVPRALRLAVEHRRTVYDSVYVALALRVNANLITADERLANALAAHLPVKWLGAYGVDRL